MTVNEFRVETKWEDNSYLLEIPDEGNWNIEKCWNGYLFGKKFC